MDPRTPVLRIVDLTCAYVCIRVCACEYVCNHEGERDIESDTKRVRVNFEAGYLECVDYFRGLQSFTEVVVTQVILNPRSSETRQLRPLVGVRKRRR